MINNIVIVGAGYVGTSLAALLCQKQEVTIVDIDSDKLKLIDQKNSGDFIIATGFNTKLRDVVKNVFLYYKLDYKKFVKISKSFIRTSEVKTISGNNTKLIKTINYKPKILMDQIIKKMIKKEF